MKISDDFKIVIRSLFSRSDIVDEFIAELEDSQPTTDKGQPLGYAPLDASGLVPAINLPPSGGLALTESTWTPVLEPNAGTFGSVVINHALSFKIDRWVFISLDFTITSNGTADGGIIVSGLPYLPSDSASMAGKEIGATGKVVSGVIAAGYDQLVLAYYDNTYSGGNGANNIISGWYRTT